MLALILDQLNFHSRGDNQNERLFKKQIIPMPYWGVFYTL